MRAADRLNEYNQEQMDDNPEALVPVHISWDEVMYFNIMQGGQSVDENTGLREYSKLSEVLKVPQIRNLFITVTDVIESGEPIPDDIAKIMDTPIEQEENGVEPIASDSDPNIQQLEETGEGKDKVIVMMPQDVVHFLDFLQGGEKTDPTLGLQEFGWLDDINPFRAAGKVFGGSNYFGRIGNGISGAMKNARQSNVYKSVVRVGATGLGAFLGGPLGAGLGNMVGRALTGQKPGMDMLMAGGKNALYAWGAGKALGSVGQGFGALGAQGAGAATTAAPIINGHTGLPYVMGNAGVQAAPQAFASSIPSLLGKATEYLPAAGLMAAGLFASHKGAKDKEKEDLKRYYQDKEENERKKRETFDYMNQPIEGEMFPSYRLPDIQPSRLNYKTGGAIKSPYDTDIRAIFRPFYNNPNAGISFDIFKQKMDEKGYSLPEKELSKLYGHYDQLLERESMPAGARAFAKQQREEIKRQKEQNRNHYKTGGTVGGIEIKGKGTGQSDDIPKTVPENSWVWDATTVAHAGDGTTNAGQKAIAKFEKMIKTHKLPDVKREIELSIKHKPLRKVPCALSNGERVTPPHLVAAAGDGCFEKGSSVLRKMTHELRKHKASKGLDLPPSAHDLSIYYKKALRGE
jgi:hypothetical protein